MRRYTVYIWKLLYMFRAVLPPIIRSAYNCIYSIWYLSHPYCYLPLSWKSWNRFECAVSGVRQPQHTQNNTKGWLKPRNFPDGWPEKKFLPYRGSNSKLPVHRKLLYQLCYSGSAYVTLYFLFLMM
jgi:hypothetical protein